LILSCLDRLPSNEVTMTQKRIADMLGVRREGVTEAAGRLEDAGIIRCRRGRILVPDRRRLETRVCECYAVVAREYDRLLRPPMPSALPTNATRAMTGAREGSGRQQGEMPGNDHAP
jgi:hypothetical protein